MTTRKLLSLLAVLMAIVLFAAACGSDDDDGDSASDDAADEEATEEAADDEAADDEAADDEAADEGDDVELTQDGGTLQAVRDRGTLICGGNDTLPGFGIVDDAGEFSGFDIDYCGVIAAAVLGDATAYEIVPLTAEARFTALQAGEIDVLIRNTTWTATRDGSEGVTFAHTIFFDGQGMMVPESTGFTTLEDLADANICVLTGTTTELNLTAVFDARGIPFNPQQFEDNTLLQPAYESGQCEAWTSDKSQLAAFKSAIEGEGGDAQFIMDETISKEPLGPATRDGDTEWAQVVDWAVLATIQGWEFMELSDGECCDSSNVGSYAGTDPNILNFIGDGGFDPGLGLSPTFAVDVISSMGNYQEIYDRHIPAIGIELSGTFNDLWLNGGLMYPPPYR